MASLLSTSKALRKPCFPIRLCFLPNNVVQFFHIKRIAIILSNTEKLFHCIRPLLMADSIASAEFQAIYDTCSIFFDIYIFLLGFVLLCLYYYLYSMLGKPFIHLGKNVWNHATCFQCFASTCKLTTNFSQYIPCGDRSCCEEISCQFARQSKMSEACRVVSQT